jgi:hypothetical protein
MPRQLVLPVNARYYLQQEHSDFTFLCRDQGEFVHIPVHSVVLRRNHAFKDILKRKDKEKVVVFDDVDSPTMKEVLRFVYAGRISALNVDVVNILKAAEKYQMDDLKKLCISKFMEKDYDDKTFSLLKLAVENGLEQLEKFCLCLICM